MKRFYLTAFVALAAFNVMVALHTAHQVAVMNRAAGHLIHQLQQQCRQNKKTLTEVVGAVRKLNRQQSPE